MLKKILILSLLASGSTFADNFYVGAGAGLSSFYSREQTLLPSEKHDFGGFGFIGGGFAGYNFSFPCSNFDVGLEVFANGVTTENKVEHLFNSTKLKVSQSYNVGVRALPGYQFSQDFEGHFIVGYTYGDFKLKDEGVYGTISKNFGLSGYQVGLGLTVDLTCHVALRLDSVYNGYPSKTHTGLSTTGLINEYKIQPHGFDSTLSVLYNF